MAMEIQQCLPLSVVQLKGKPWQKPYCRNGVVDAFKFGAQWSLSKAFWGSVTQIAHQPARQLQCIYCLTLFQLDRDNFLSPWQTKPNWNRVKYSQWFGKITDYGHPMKAYIKEIWKFGPMWQTKYASAVPKSLGLGVDFRPFSEDDFITGRP